jgi:hypothetical protein
MAVSITPPHVRVLVSWPSGGFDLGLLDEPPWYRDDVAEP